MSIVYGGPFHVSGCSVQLLWLPTFCLPKKGHSSPLLFGTRLMWPNGRPSQPLLSTCLRVHTNAFSAEVRWGSLQRPRSPSWVEGWEREKGQERGAEGQSLSQ